MATATKKASGTRSRGNARPKSPASSARRGAAKTAQKAGKAAPAKVKEKAKDAVAKPAEAAAVLPGKAAAKGLKMLGKGALAAAREIAGRAREHTTGALAGNVRRLPIQRSIDVAVPVEVAWDEWMRLEFLPEGAHRVEDIERDGDGYLVGTLTGLKVADDWEAEILDERQDESFAWRSTQGSDCAGLVTFHRIAERLTRIELELDVVPSRLGEAASLALHVADHRALTDLRLFKANVETISPDEYPPLDDEEADNEPPPDDEEADNEPSPEPEADYEEEEE
jgi:uncharacterized membrane protein